MKGFIKRFLATVLTVVMLLTAAPLNGFVDLFDFSIEASAASGLTGSTTEEKIWNFFKSNGFTNYGVAGLMGNLYAESALNSKNLQGSYEKKLGYTDATYTTAVDNNTYKNFTKDSAGYGLAQWTYWSRKKKLYDFCKDRKTSVGDLESQLLFCLKELKTSYSSVYNTLKKAKTIEEASDAVLTKYEKPANMGTSVKNKRISYGKNYYNKFANASSKTWFWPLPGGEFKGHGFNCTCSTHGGSHKGIDISGAAYGSDVVAAVAGTVTCASTKDRCPTCDQRDGGIHVEIKASGYSNMYTTYAHLSKLAVKTGDKVEAGQTIGYVGNSGVAYGTHLHFGISQTTGAHFYWNNPKYIDPFTYLSDDGNFNIAKPSTKSVDNQSAVVVTDTNQMIKVLKVAYFISTTKSDIDVDVKVSGTIDKLDKKGLYKKTNDYTKSPKSLKSFSASIEKHQGVKLKPNTTYYYRLLIKTATGWQQSSISSFKTTNALPGKPELTFATGKTDYAKSDSVAVTWKSVKNADSYNITVYNSDFDVVHIKNGITSNSYSLAPNSEWLNSAGDYYISIAAVNAVGKTEASGKKKFTVHEDKTVEFYDTVSKQVIKTEKVPYGKSAIAPEKIEQYGYTFIKWDKEFTCVTENIRVNTVYEAKKYSVKFVDGLTGKVLATQTVRYNETAVAPEVSSVTGYDFIGWNKDFSNIKEDTTITSNYKWYNESYPVVSEIMSVTRNETKDGYDVVVKVESGVDETVQGRLVMTLKTDSGYQITESESSAFSISGKSVKEISAFIPSESLAYKIEVFLINDFEKMGIIAKPVSKLIDNSSAWSEWIVYTTDIPVKEGANGVSAVETKVETTEDVVLYRYRDKNTTTSYNTSMSGWTQNGGTWVQSGTGSIVYAKKWPSGFNKNHSLYSKYNKTPKSATETTTQKVVINSNSVTGYVYWHWCRGRKLEAPTNSYIANQKEGEFDTFHAFYSTTEKTEDTNATKTFKWKQSSQCMDSYYWWCDKSLGGNGAVQIYTQKYTTYKKLFNYYKWSAWSDWSETAVSATSTREVESQIIPGETLKFYRYKTSEPVATVNVPEEQIKDISVKVSESYANMEAVVTVYKYLRASDYTIEFIDDVMVGTDGTIIIDDIALREALSVDAGDFKIIVSIAGNSVALELGVFEAPKPIYNVKFYDFNGIDVIYEVDVEAGEAVVVPEEYMDKLNVPEGYMFTNWNQSTVNVNSDLNVMPLNEKNKYVVVFVDWAIQEVVLQELDYGTEIIPPLATPQKGKNVSWDMSNACKIIEGEEEKYIVVENTVISTVYTDIVYNSTFVSPDSDIAKIENGLIIEGSNVGVDGDNSEIVINEEDIISVETNTFDEYIDTPIEVEEAEEYIFRGWKNIMTGEYLESTLPTSDAIYVPMFEFAEYAETPAADIVTGEYTEAQTVTLTSATESAVIYYTLDGTDPQTSETAVMYTDPITISSSTVLKFCAMAVNMNNSDTVMELYAINTDDVVPYHIVSVYTDLPYEEGFAYQSLVKDFVRFDATPLQDVTGYIYSGLYYDEDFTEEFDTQNEPVIESMDVYAHYVPLQYKVTFLNDDGTQLDEQLVNYSEAAVEPEVPVKEGYVFVGWDSDGYECVTEEGVYTARYIPESEYAYVTIKGRATRPAYTGGDIKLTAVITPDELANEPVSWTSSDSSVATVDYMGNVSCVGIGTAYVTVTVDSNGESYSVKLVVNEDNTAKVVLGPQSYLVVDSLNYIRGLKVAVNTVEEVRSHFTNDVIYFYDKDGKELSATEKVGTDTVVKLIDGEEVLDERIFIMTGDVNGDGWYDAQDSTIVSCLASGLLTSDQVSEAVYIAADCNYDGVINQIDVDLLNKAGALLSNIDQTQSVEELQTDAAYIEYVELIDQTADIEIEVEDKNENDSDTEIKDDVVDDDITDDEQSSSKMSLIDLIIAIIKSFFEMLLALFV